MVSTKKKYKPGAIVASREEMSIVINFEKEELTMDDSGEACAQPRAHLLVTGLLCMSLAMML